jgi:hypothetical protein
MCESDTSSSNDSGSNDNGSTAVVTPVPAPAPAPAPTPAPATEAVTGVAAGEITTDENGNAYRVVDNGGYTTRDYSVAAPASSAPASSPSTGGSNNFIQTIANILTPGDGQEYVDGVLVDTPTVLGGRRLDADNLAGSNYAPTANAGTANAVQDYTPPEQGSNDFGQNVANILTPNDGTTYVNGVLMGDYQGPNIDGSAGYNATGSGLNDQAFTMSTNPLFPNNSAITDGGTTITSPNGTVTTLADQQANFTDPNFNTDAPGLIATIEQDGTRVRNPIQPTVSTPVDSGPSQEEIENQRRIEEETRKAEEDSRLAAERQAAIDGALGRLSDAFGFATNDYFSGLGTNYRDQGLSPAFTTAYDDAVRGVFDTYKAAGMLNQSDVDDDLKFISSSGGSEQDRLDNIVSNYVTANREYVSDGMSSIADQIRGLGSVEDINNFDTVAASQPYRQPTEQSVVDFFTDFAKRSYDPSYNVDPSAVSSGGPRRVSGSVDQLGAGTQPSTVAGIFDPLAGSSARVVA